jgi:hypothetical protein
VLASGLAVGTPGLYVHDRTHLGISVEDNQPIDGRRRLENWGVTGGLVLPEASRKLVTRSATPDRSRDTMKHAVGGQPARDFSVQPQHA